MVINNLKHQTNEIFPFHFFGFGLFYHSVDHFDLRKGLPYIYSYVNMQHSILRKIMGFSVPFRKVKNQNKSALKMVEKTHLDAHFVFNSLNAIQHFIIENEKELSLKYLSMFGKLIRHHMGNAGAEYARVGDELEMVDVYLKLQKLRFGDKFTYDFNVEDLFYCGSCHIKSNLIGNIVGVIMENMPLNVYGSFHLNIYVKILEKGVRLEFGFAFSTKIGENGGQAPENYNEITSRLIKKIESCNIGAGSMLRADPEGPGQLEEMVLYIPYQYVPK